MKSCSTTEQFVCLTIKKGIRYQSCIELNRLAEDREDKKRRIYVGKPTELLNKTKTLPRSNYLYYHEKTY